MARAKKPVSVNGIEFDALITEDRVYEASTPEYAVESGFVVSDAIIHNPFRVSMVLYITETPVTWKGIFWNLPLLAEISTLGQFSTGFVWGMV